MADFNPRNIRDAIRSWTPNWLARTNAFKWLFAMALEADFFAEAMFEGSIAPFPGKGTPTALPYIGRSRGIIRGLLETDDEYAARLLEWLTLWESAGSEETLIKLIQGFLGNGYAVRHISRNGLFTSIDGAGVITQTTDTSWDWDSFATPSTASHWSDCWIVVYVTDGRFPITAAIGGDTIGAAPDFGLGHEVTRAVVDGIYQIVAAFKGAHTYLQAIIWTDDTSLFVPGSLGGTPDGHYAYWSKRNGSDVQVPARVVTSGGGYVRYWIPATGG